MAAAPAAVLGLAAHLAGLLEKCSAPMAGARPKRARRNSSYLDADFGDGGEYGERLPATFVIFITERDPLKGGLKAARRALQFSQR